MTEHNPQQSTHATEASRQQVAENLKRLQQASLQAIQAGDFGRSSQLLQAMEQLDTWLKGDPKAPLPVDIDEIFPPEISIDDRKATPVSVPPEPHLQAIFEEAKGKVLRKDYPPAIADLETILVRTQSPELRQRAQAEYERAGKAMERLVEELCQRAQSVPKQHPDDWTLQRRAWDEVLQKDPDNRTALDALDIIAQRESLALQRAKLQPLREALNKRESFSEIENAWNRARQLRGDGSQISDPDIQLELERLYLQLNAERDNFVRLGRGGASQERAENYEEALAVYENALSEGKTSIPDDITGEELIVTDALKRTRTAYAADLRKRVGDRLGWAKDSLTHGAPETAIEHLSKVPLADAERPGARPLLERIYTVLGGDVSSEDKRLREELENLLETAQRESAGKKQAEALIAEADKAQDPEGARLKLLEAQRVYSKYPDIEKKIQAAESRCVSHAAQVAQHDLSKARAALQQAWLFGKAEEAAREFTGARVHCENARKRAANFDTSANAWRDLQQDIESLLKKIEETQPRHLRMLNQLQGLDEAIAGRNLRLAETLLRDLERDFPKEHEFSVEPYLGVRRERATLLKDDYGKYLDAQTCFNRNEYDRVVKICGELLSSTTYASDASKLMYRAQVRLWEKVAEDAYTKGDLEKAIQQYREIEACKQKGQLPEIDLEIYNTACARITTIQQEQSEAQNLKARFESVKALRRQQEEVNWDAWWDEISKLRDEMPAWLRKDLETELQDGKKSWVDEKLEAAQRASDSQITRIYNDLKRLQELELLSSDQREWRKIQFTYHTQKSQGLIQGVEVAGWKEAIDHATQARDFAPAEKLREAETHRNTIIHRSILQSAAYEAARLDAGPQSAAEVLRTEIDRFPWLAQDAEIRARLLGYYLDGADWEQARQQASAMRYVEAEKTGADGWEKIVEAVILLHDDKYPQSVAVLLELAQKGIQSDRLAELRENWKNRMLTRLRVAEKQYEDRRGGNSLENLLMRIELLDLIGQLLPTDVDVSGKLLRLSDQLGQLIQPLRDEADQLRLRDSLVTSLEEGEALLNQINAVIRTLKRVEKQDLALLLQKTEEDVRQRVEKWRGASEALRELEEKWSNSVGGGWETKPLSALLDKAQTSASDAEEVKWWELRVSNLKRVFDGKPNDIKGLRQLVGDTGELGKAWKGEHFDVFVKYLQETEEMFTRAKAELSEDKFVIPDRYLTFFDPFTNNSVSGFVALRTCVEKQKRNFAEWSKWYEQFVQKANSLASQWKQVDDWTNAQPPCLSSALNLLEKLPAELIALRQIVEEQPTEILSGQAKTFDERVGPKDSVFADLDKKVAEAQELKERVESKLEATLGPLEALENFFHKGKKNLQHKKNRERAKALIDRLLSVDACHPKAAEYEDELSYWSN